MFLRVHLPQLRVALLGGSLLVALHLLAEFGALQMLRYPTFTTAIYDQYRATFNGPGATMLAGVLVLLCLVLLLAEIRLRGRRGYARTGRGRLAPAPPGGARPAHRPALAGLAAVVVLALVVPLGSLGYWMVAGGSTAFDAEALADHHRDDARRWPPRPRPPSRSPWRCPRAGSPSGPAAGCPRCWSGRPTSAARCPASSSPWRWSP